MAKQNAKLALTVLQWTLGVVISIEAVRFLMPGAAHAFNRTHMPNFIRLALGFGEIAGCILMLIPRTGPPRRVVAGRGFCPGYCSSPSARHV